MTKLVTRYHFKLMIFFNRRTSNHWDAEELTQEVYCKIMNGNYGDAVVDDFPEPYIFTIAWSVLHDSFRRDQVRKRDKHVMYEEADEQQTISPDKRLHSEQRYAKFVTVLESLSPQTRAIFLLNRYEGLTASQLAECFSISVSAVEKHMMKALSRIKEELMDSSWMEIS